MTNFHCDWADLFAALGAMEPHVDLDDWIDERMEEAAPWLGAQGAHTGASGADPTDFLLAALQTARSESTRRDVAAALARHGRAGDMRVVDALIAAFRSAGADDSLGPALLAALAALAERDSIARPDIFSAVLRVTSADPRYLVIRAAKIIGHFESLGVLTNARSKLEGWADADDLEVQGEARQQLALLALASALTQADVARLRSALRDCRAAFLRAELSEELRHDAQTFGALLDLLLAHLETEGAEPEYARVVRDRALTLKALLDDPLRRPWVGYASRAELMVEHRLYSVAVGFMRLAEDVNAMAGWTNFDASLTELAAGWNLMWARSSRDKHGSANVVSAAEVSVVLPMVGSFLERAVGRQRLLRVVDRHELARGAQHSVSLTLREFYEAACRAEHEPGVMAPLTIDRDALMRLVTDKPAIAAQVISMIPGADALLAEAGLKLTADTTGLQAYRVPTDHPACYGDDPAVDDTARPLLEAAWARLAPRFPISRWHRFRDLTVSLIRIARDLRSDLPSFVLSASERDGKGQTAVEDNLQEYVFAALRREYGRAVQWEPTRIAGGRSDNGVVFAEGAFPIEVKAEYRDVEREHIGAAFLTQPDRYATDRDRVAYLLVLDVRAEHAAAETALYSLRESFWLDGLSTDPQIVGAQRNVVVVGLFPGNQPKPSSTTTYSRRPRARRSADTTLPDDG